MKIQLSDFTCEQALHMKSENGKLVYTYLVSAHNYKPYIDESSPSSTEHVVDVAAFIYNMHDSKYAIEFLVELGEEDKERLIAKYTSEFVCEEAEIETPLFFAERMAEMHITHEKYGLEIFMMTVDEL